MTNSSAMRRLLVKVGPAVGVGLVLILFAGTVSALVERFIPGSGPIQQPIAFSHQKHVSGKDGIKCTTCHKYVEKDIFASLPQVDTCTDCHQIVMRMSPKKLAKKPEFAKLKEYIKAGYIPWNRIYRQPDYVFFSHRRHVVAGKVECKTCHGDMTKLTAPLPRPVVNQTMTWCMNCHEQKQASVDCIACHK